VGKARIFDGNTYFSDTSEHTSISSLTVRLMKWALLNSNYNSFPSSLLIFLSSKYGDSPFFQVHLLFILNKLRWVLFIFGL
jgi:hypothetical protein